MPALDLPNSAVFFYVDGVQFFKTDKPFKPYDYYYRVRGNEWFVGLISDVIGDNIVKHCYCGQCPMEDRLVPISECIHLIPVNIKDN